MNVKFLPKKSIDVEVCDIYEDRDAVIVQHTDTLASNTCYNVEALGFRFGIKPCAFVYPYSGVQEPMIEMNKTGVMKFGVYIPTDRWRGESTSGPLPDYTATQLTAAGAAYYGRPIGTPKTASSPNQGQSLFDFTLGVKGYDVNNSVPGSEGNMDFIREMEYIDSWYRDYFGRLPSSGSDRQGRIGSKQIYMPYYLGIRMTQPDGNVDYYGLDRLDIIHKAITSRWENGFINGTIPAADALLIDGINEAFNSKGLFNDFVHWHRAVNYEGVELLEYLYELIYDTVGGRNAWYTGYSEAVEYYWYRSMTKRVRGHIDGERLYLVADFDDEFIGDALAGIPKRLIYDRIHQPLTVKIDLTGTVLAGKDIGGAEMISLGSNEYLVDIPLITRRNGFQPVVLREVQSPAYKDFTVPTIISEDDGVITTNIPTKAVLFDGAGFDTQMSVAARSNQLGGTHDFSEETGTRIGLVSKYGASSLTTL